jgi:hypothetical protein
VIEQELGGHDESGSAVTTLEPMLINESLLDEVKMLLTCYSLHGCDLVTVGLDRQDRAGLDCYPVQEHRAGTALAGVAANVRTGQANLLAKVLREETSRFNRVLSA